MSPGIQWWARSRKAVFGCLWPKSLLLVEADAAWSGGIFRDSLYICRHIGLISGGLHSHYCLGQHSKSACLALLVLKCSCFPGLEAVGRTWRSFPAGCWESGLLDSRCCSLPQIPSSLPNLEFPLWEAGSNPSPYLKIQNTLLNATSTGQGQLITKIYFNFFW